MFAFTINFHNYVLHFAGILVNPSNQTVPMNTTTSFFCKASGRNARWYVNGTLVVNEEQYAELGITFSETSESTSPDDHIHTFNMTITVVASVAINATNFICLVYVDGTSVSETAQLIVMGKSILIIESLNADQIQNLRLHALC